MHTRRSVLPSRSRRRLLRGAGAAVSLGLVSLAAAARVDAAGAFAATSFADALGALGAVPLRTALITLDLPALSESGAVVPVTVASALPNTREILLLVDGNPQPVAAHFVIPVGTEPFVATRIRMAASGTVYAAVRTDDGLFAAARTVEVTVGGCG